MSSTNILDIVITVLGIYLICVTLGMKKDKKINKMFLAPEELKKVKDVEGFINFVSPVCLIFGVITIILGILGLVSGLVYEIKYYNWIEMIIFVITLIIFANRFTRAREKYCKIFKVNATPLLRLLPRKKK